MSPLAPLLHTYLLYQRLSNRTVQDGASSVEYGLLAAGVAGLLAAVVFLFGDTALELFTSTCDEFAKEIEHACVEG